MHVKFFSKRVEEGDGGGICIKHKHSDLKSYYVWEGLSLSIVLRWEGSKENAWVPEINFQYLLRNLWVN